MNLVKYALLMAQKISSKYKEHYHLQTNINKEYNNCVLDLIPNDNCTSSQIDMNKYKDFCH